MGWMDGWMDGRTDGWMDGRLHEMVDVSAKDGWKDDLVDI
jgi:hypothetical protein